MKIRILVAALLATPMLASAQPLPGKEPAKKEAAPKKDSAKGAPPIATVNGVGVPRARAEALLSQQKARGAPDNDQTRQMVREELVNREVLMQEAQKSGVARSSEVTSQLDLARQEIIISAYLREWVRKNPVSDADVQKEYERVKAEQGDKEYRARHILVETEDQAKQMVAELKKGGKFEELAAKNSKDPGSKDRGGDLDWHGPGDFDRTFSEAMMKLEKGKFTDTPVRTRFGFHIIQLEDVRSGRFPSFAEVKPRIQQQLTQTRIDELVKGLRGKAKVE
ncbi:MAG TPA: peptidylprolyl isomerase [Burkholderiales bacterium]|nr:peptidylprolyl isomerase [Burkholderiales bacterium]